MWLFETCFEFEQDNNFHTEIQPNSFYKSSSIEESKITLLYSNTRIIPPGFWLLF